MMVKIMIVMNSYDGKIMIVMNSYDGKNNDRNE